MITEFKIGDEVTMCRSWLKSTMGIFDSPYHHKGKVTEVRKSTLVIVWPFEEPATVLTKNVILNSEKHKELS